YNTTVNNYIEAETRFATLMSDIYNIIEKALGFESHEIEPDDNK
ncbi:MAG: YlbF family regulator, partial [Thermoanaerobacterales bacterium]|nr:YlbF family regulator [Thermoanaerobacterales bacterium]